MKKNAIKITTLCIAGLFTSLALANVPANTCPNTVTWHPDASSPEGGYITGKFSDGEVLPLPVSGSRFGQVFKLGAVLTTKEVFDQDYVTAKYQTAAQKNLESVECQFFYQPDKGGESTIRVQTTSLAGNYVFVPAHKENYWSDAPEYPKNKTCEQSRDCEFTLKEK